MNKCWQHDPHAVSFGSPARACRARTNHAEAPDRHVYNAADRQWWRSQTRTREQGGTILNALFANPDPPRRKLQILVLLTFAAGFVDTAGFIMLFELFTAHITGNTVIALADIVHRGGAGALAAFLMLPIFICTVILATLFIDAVKGPLRERILALMLAVQTVLLGLFFVASLLLDPSHSTPNGLPVIIVGGIGVMAMGVQNTLAGVLPKPSTVMTGNLTNTIIHAVRWVHAMRARDGALRSKAAEQLRILWPTLAAFTLGGLLAAVGVVTIGYWCLLIPVPFTAAAAVYAIGVPPEGGLVFHPTVDHRQEGRNQAGLVHARKRSTAE